MRPCHRAHYRRRRHLHRDPGRGSDRPGLGLAVRWNTYELTARGRQITVILNGEKTAELHNGLFAEGPFALQHGEGVLKFRKVAVKPL